MLGLDHSLSGLAQGHGAAVVLLVAFLLGLRHASDPDHLVAVSTLVASTRERATRAASLLGAAWGLGHATTLLVFGVPAIVLQAHLPRAVESVAETLIGAIIVVLGARLLLRWRRGAFHVHEHEHDGASHVHVHAHGHEPRHEHAHAPRSPAQAFAVGLVHGMAGSGGVAILLVAAVPDRSLAVLALLVLVAGTALSMTLMSAVIGRVLGGSVARRRFAYAVPVLGATALLFGAWYAAGALAAL